VVVVVVVVVKSGGKKKVAAVSLFFCAMQIDFGLNSQPDHNESCVRLAGSLPNFASGARTRSFHILSPSSLSLRCASLFFYRKDVV
jgi:hypothetical protein